MATDAAPLPVIDDRYDRAFELLLLCSRTRIAARDDTRLRTLDPGEVDWARLVALAAIHGTRPLVYRTLSTTCSHLVPSAVLQALRDQVIEIAGKNLFLMVELMDVLLALESERIHALPFKGPVLAADAYGSVALREFRDLDIVVEKREIERVGEILRAGGYAELGTSPGGDEYSRVFTRDAAVVDLHWAFAGNRFFFRNDPKALWQRRVAIDVSGQRMSSLAPEDNLLLLCMHGAKHCWSRLAWVCDVAELITSHSNLDWVALVSRAKVFGAERMLYLGLYLAADLLGAQLPAEVHAHASQPSVAVLSGTVRSWMMQEIDGAAKPLERETFYVSMRERLSDRARHVLAGIVRFALPTARDRRALPLPSPLWFVHLLTRPVRLVATYGNPAIVLKRLTGRL